ALLVGDAAGSLGADDPETTKLRRAALLHEVGTTSIPNSILDKPRPLTRAEFDRVGHHPPPTEPMLRPPPALAELTAVAAAHHEKVDGTGYHKGLRAGDVGDGARILAAADIYVGLTTDRADRPAFSEEYAAAELRRLVSDGVHDGRSAEAVL